MQPVILRCGGVVKRKRPVTGEYETQRCGTLFEVPVRFEKGSGLAPVAEESIYCKVCGALLVRVTDYENLDGIKHLKKNQIPKAKRKTNAEVAFLARETKDRKALEQRDIRCLD